MAIVYNGQWEYLRLADYEFDVKMREIGNDRWELVNMIQGDRNEYRPTMFYFKRPKMEIT